MELAHTRRGTGPALVVLQHVVAEVLWQPVVDRISAEREVISVDVPGFGQSPPLPDGRATSIPELATGVSEWFDEIGLERPHVVGNSVAGAVAIELARANAVHSATAISPAGFWTSVEAAPVIAWVGAANLTVRAAGPYAGFGMGNPVGRRLVWSRLMERWSDMPAEAAKAALRDMPGLFGSYGRSPRITAAFVQATLSYRVRGFDPPVPLTIAWGDHDRITPYEQAGRAERTLPNARHVPLPGCGHVPMFDAPDLVARTVLEGSRGS